jgi:hypothetical protein
MAEFEGHLSVGGDDGWALCPPRLEAIRCRECGRQTKAQRHSPMALAGCCYEHVPPGPRELSCPRTCFSEN